MVIFPRSNSGAVIPWVHPAGRPADGGGVFALRPGPAPQQLWASGQGRWHGAAARAGRLVTRLLRRQGGTRRVGRWGTGCAPRTLYTGPQRRNCGVRETGQGQQDPGVSDLATRTARRPAAQGSVSGSRVGERAGRPALKELRLGRGPTVSGAVWRRGLGWGPWRHTRGGRRHAGWHEAARECSVAREHPSWPRPRVPPQWAPLPFARRRPHGSAGTTSAPPTSGEGPRAAGPQASLPRPRTPRHRRLQGRPAGGRLRVSGGRCEPPAGGVCAPANLNLSSENKSKKENGPRAKKSWHLVVQ